MCGIAGFLSQRPLATDGHLLLERMVAAIRHRGPDGHGIHVDGGIGLGHARLSIIDIAGGRQPMASADGALSVSFNGEIFNYLELRDALARRGRRFRTQSDTEVILHLYDEMGPECVTAMNGDFAFALWDAQRKRLMLARDRMGVRPLFYTQRDGALFFASEVKALLAVPGLSAELDPKALDQIFTLWFPLAPRTPFKRISELPPAHILLADDNGIVLRPYWRLSYPDAAEAAAWDDGPAEAIAEELRALLLDATRIRLRADVPVGAYLSGGLDSSITTAAARTFVNDRLRSFSVTFEQAEFDESDHQQAMVRALGTEHSALACRAADIAAVFPQVVGHGERPILRTAPAPLYMLAKLTRESGFKVVLTGEGADEIFAGYDIFKEAKLRRFCARAPQSRLRPLLLRRLYPYLPALQGQSQRYLEAFFAVAPGDLDDPLFSHLPRLRNTAAAKIFFSRALRAELGDYDCLAELRDNLPADFSRWHPLNQAQFLETQYLLPGYILSSQGDRVAMAHAVEGRFPFLDHRLVEFAARIPPALKIRGLREKHILREAMAGLLPTAIGDRPKQPYRAPDALSFVAPDAPDYVGEVLSAPALRATGCFEPSAVEKLLAKCRAGRIGGFRDNAAFVGILSTQLWHRAFACPPQALSPSLPSAVA